MAGSPARHLRPSFGSKIRRVRPASVACFYAGHGLHLRLGQREIRHVDIACQMVSLVTCPSSMPRVCGFLRCLPTLDRRKLKFSGLVMTTGWPHRSKWKVEPGMPIIETKATYQVSSFRPGYFMLQNPDRKGPLGGGPGCTIHRGKIAYGPFDFKNASPMLRNAYIANSVWNTDKYPEERYAGRKFATASGGSATLAQLARTISCCGTGICCVVHRRLSPRSEDRRLAREVDRMDDRAHHVAHLPPNEPGGITSRDPQ